MNNTKEYKDISSKNGKNKMQYIWKFLKICILHSNGSNICGIINNLGKQ